ncbi:MAG: flagellar biosynthesis repressor FlbT [Rhizobiaceae bacterium]
MSTFKISLKPHERVYINGAVIKVDRKTSLEFLNDVQFLLESQVLQAAEADTPLKRLYFTVQIQLMSPSDTTAARRMFKEQLEQLLLTFEESTVRDSLVAVERLVADGRFHEAMKSLKSLYPIEQRLLNGINTSFPFEESEPLQAKAG